MPLGVSPNGNDFLPSGAVTSAITKFQLPTIPSFKLAGCAAAAPPDSASASKAVMVLNIMDPPWENVPALKLSRVTLRRAIFSNRNTEFWGYYHAHDRR